MIIFKGKTIQFSEDELNKVKKLAVDLDVDLTVKSYPEFIDNVSKMVEIEKTETYFDYDKILSQIDNLLIIECTRKESGEVISTNFYNYLLIYEVILSFIFSNYSDSCKKLVVKLLS